VAPAARQSFKDATAWLHKLVHNHEALEDDGHGAEDEEFEMHRILAKLAGMYGAGGHGLKRSAAKAAELYNEAAGAAEMHMKAKVASKYYELAAEFEVEEEEEDDEEESTSAGAHTPGGASSSMTSMVSSPSVTSVQRRPIALGAGGKAALSRWFEGVSDSDRHATPSFIPRPVPSPHRGAHSARRTLNAPRRHCPPQL